MKKNELIYYIALLLLIFISLADISRIINIDGVFRNIVYLISMILFLIKIFLSKYNKKEIIFIIFLGAISLFISYKLSDFLFLMNFLAVAAISGVDIKKVIKIDLVLKIFFLLIHSIIYFNDFLFAYDKIVPYLVYTNAYGARHSFYFSHPNTANAIVTWLIIDWIIIAKNKKKAIIIGSLIMLIYSYFIVSRTSIIIYLLFLLILYFVKNNKFTKIISFLSKQMFNIMLLINLLIISTQNIMNNAFILSLDKILSRRLYFTNLAMGRYGFHIFPNKITDNVLDNSLIVDNFFVRSFISYGFIVLIIIVFLYYLANKRKELNKFELAVLIIFPLYLFNELFPFNVGRCVVLLIIANIIFNKSYIKQTE